MSILSAIVKSALRYTNSKIAEHDRKKAKRLAYKKTGKEIKAANRQGKYVNGSHLYKQNLSKRTTAINQRQLAFNDFIGDL